MYIIVPFVFDPTIPPLSIDSLTNYNQWKHTMHIVEHVRERALDGTYIYIFHVSSWNACVDTQFPCFKIKIQINISLQSKI